MLTIAGRVFWICPTLLSVVVVFLIIVRGQFRRFSALAIYFAFVTAVNLLRMRIFSTYGIASREYAYFFFATDLLLSLLLYCVLASLYRKIFSSKKLRLHVTVGPIVIAAGISIAALEPGREASSHHLARWIIEYNQDLYFVCTLAALALFAAATYKSNTYKPLHQLTLLFAVYYLSFALAYVSSNLPPVWSSLNESVVSFGTWLPMGVAYVFCDPSLGNSLDEPPPQM